MTQLGFFIYRNFCVGVCSLFGYMYVARWVRRLFAIRNCWTNQINAISCVFFRCKVELFRFFSLVVYPSNAQLAFF